MELPRDWKLLTEREILGKLYERVVALEEEIYYLKNMNFDKDMAIVYKKENKQLDRIY